MNFKFKKRWHFWAMIAMVVFVTNAVTLFIYAKRNNTSWLNCVESYSFINPRYRCGKTDIVDKRGYSVLKSKLGNYIEQKKIEKKADLVGVWFRDLESGPTFGINDRVDFIPASLLKLPLAMTFFDLAVNDDPQILSRPIDSSSRIAQTPTQVFKPQDPLKTKTSYTILELIEHSLSHSDNNAAQLLYEYLLKNYRGRNPLEQTYRDIGILDPELDLNAAVVNTKQYGSIFRLLYNTSFLEKDSSEKILLFLSQSEFQDGLVRGVPQGIIVAHKFGERYLDNGAKQLHDCGIIYYPGNPYQLCVMTRGKNYDDLKEIIAEISKQVYTEFDSRKIEGGDLWKLLSK